MVRRCYLTACFVVLTLCLYAQHVTYIPQSLPPCFDTYFPKGSIKAMVQTDDGFLWLGTSIGLIRYDGYEFLMSNGPDSLWKENESVGVSAMCKDNKGNIWLGYLDAVGCYNTRTNIYKRYPFDKSIMSGVSNVYGIYAENDDVWFGCSGNGMVQLHVPTGKMCRYNIATKERFPYMSEIRIDKCNYVHEIKKRDKNNLWLASSEGLMSFNIQTHEITLMQPKPDPKNVDEYNVIALLPIGSKVWVGGWQSGVQCYDTLTKTWERFLLSKEANAEFIETVGALLPKGDHELWVGTGGYGLCTFNTITKNFNFYIADSMCTGMYNDSTTKFGEIAARPNAVDSLAKFNVYNSSTGTLLTVTGDGNVGIKSANHTAELEVIGFTKLGTDAPAIKMKKITGLRPPLKVRQ